MARDLWLGPWGLAALGTLVLTACQATASLPSPSPLQENSPTPTSTQPRPLDREPSPSEEPRPQGQPLAYFVDETRTCVGGELRVSAFDQGPDVVFQAWLVRDTPFGRDIADLKGDRVPYAVYLGEVPYRGDRTHEGVFPLLARMGPLTTGGEMVMEVGESYGVLLTYRSRGRLQRATLGAMGFRLQRRSESGSCHRPSPVPLTRTIRVQAPIICLNDPVRLEGSGLEPGDALVTVKNVSNPRAPSLEAEWTETRIDASGRLAEVLDISTRAGGFVEGGDYLVRVYDQSRTRVTETRFSACYGTR